MLPALAGFVIGLVFGTAFTGVPLVGLVAGFAVGILLAIVFVFAFRLAGAVLGGFAGAAVAAVLGLAGWMLVALVVLGVVVGLVANRPVIVVATALEGGGLAAVSALSLLELAGAHLEREDTVAFVLALIIAVLGAASQWRSIRERPT